MIVFGSWSSRYNRYNYSVILINCIPRAYRYMSAYAVDFATIQHAVRSIPSSRYSFVCRMRCRVEPHASESANVCYSYRLCRMHEFVRIVPCTDRYTTAEDDEMHQNYQSHSKKQHLPGRSPESCPSPDRMVALDALASRRLVVWRKRLLPLLVASHTWMNLDVLWINVDYIRQLLWIRFSIGIEVNTDNTTIPEHINVVHKLLFQNILCLPVRMQRDIRERLMLMQHSVCIVRTVSNP